VGIVSRSQGGGSAFSGGQIALEASADLTLVNLVPAFLTFGVLFSTSADVTLGVDNQTLTFHATGWYTVWYSFSIQASATTVKSQVQSFLDCSDPLNWFRQTSLGETILHLSGSVSLLDLIVPYTSPPVHFDATNTLKMGAVCNDTGGSVGSSIVTSNTFAAIIRLA
jgi:hypothetical protein